MSILNCGDIPIESLQQLLEKYCLSIHTVADGEDIPGSWFGDSEAGIIGQQLYVRKDTPVHSALHESCHYICMDSTRREQLHTDAGGGYDEENGVCYLQTILADYIAEFGRARSFSDMDEWGYSFRLGSAQKWFEEDAEDAREWLLQHGLVTADDKPTWQLRS
ncbi:MAG: hypothetical protein OEY43_03480 [Gammaproteobacteria bacterium]|nr:hypothetical protein [Gammaproteobacteria bacterium]